MVYETVTQTQPLREGVLEAKSNRYLFKGILDAVFYLFVYLALPLYSIVQGINQLDGTIYFTAFSCCVCVIYDCYSRYDKTALRLKIKKIYWIAAINFGLAVYSWFSIQSYIENGQLLFPWVYVLLAVAPIIGGVDLAAMLLDDYKARSE